MNGLHSCKPGNEPIVGQVKTFLIEQRTGRSGNPYTKIKSASADQGGMPFRITAVKPTGHTDSYGNISFNLDIEPEQRGDEHGIEEIEESGGGSTYRKVASPHYSNGLDERQRAIIRQHSQSMALEVLKLKHALGELTLGDLSPAKLRLLADYFDNDVLKTPAPHRPVDIDEPSSGRFRPQEGIRPPISAPHDSEGIGIEESDDVPF